ncbi:hypothetical protein BJ878DRAFT_578371 [Calycina marina]|uniref:Uncharacterized protein n=1 Tax=Calycina marina TaxID=1763456 RepID=A0A9P7YY60_9HELO|nr:hypothetical protein BJ878DRAFT_578371 [Calycina marina]
MSCLTRTVLRAPRTIAFAPRAFSTTFVTQKTATETAKDTLHAADKAVAGKIVDGIEVGQKAAGKVKEAAGMSKGEVEGKAAEAAGTVKGKTAELKGQASGKAEEIKGKMQ